MQLAIPTVTTAIACGMLNAVTVVTTLRALSTMMPGLCGDACMMPSVMRFMSTTAATTKMPNVTRAFSRMPRMLRSAIAQMIVRMTVWYVVGPRRRNAVPLVTALTVEMHAVRMYDTMIDATATNDAVGPSTKYENE